MINLTRAILNMDDIAINAVSILLSINRSCATTNQFV